MCPIVAESPGPLYAPPGSVAAMNFRVTRRDHKTHSAWFHAAYTQFVDTIPVSRTVAEIFIFGL